MFLWDTILEKKTGEFTAKSKEVGKAGETAVNGLLVSKDR